MHARNAHNGSSRCTCWVCCLPPPGLSRRWFSLSVWTNPKSWKHAEASLQPTVVSFSSVSSAFEKSGDDFSSKRPAQVLQIKGCTGDTVPLVCISSFFPAYVHSRPIFTHVFRFSFSVVYVARVPCCPCQQLRCLKEAVSTLPSLVYTSVLASTDVLAIASDGTQHRRMVSSSASSE